MAKVKTKMRASICISKLDTSMVSKGKDGKDYINVNLVIFDEVNQYGSIGLIEVYVPKDKRVENQNYVVGNIRKFEDKPQQQQQTTDKDWTITF